MPATSAPLLEGARLAWLFPLLSAAVFAWLVLAGGLRPWTAATAHVLLLSVVSWVLFAWDKRQARRELRRVSEANLLGLALLGGALGACWAMALHRHKTRRVRFRLLVPAALICHVAAVVWLAAHGA